MRYTWPYSLNWYLWTYFNWYQFLIPLVYSYMFYVCMLSILWYQFQLVSITFIHIYLNAKLENFQMVDLLFNWYLNKLMHMFSWYFIKGEKIWCCLSIGIWFPLPCFMLKYSFKIGITCLKENISLIDIKMHFNYLFFIGINVLDFTPH